MGTHSVERHLSVRAGEYDAQIRRFIPFYEEMIGTAVAVLGDLTRGEAHVLDLGGGTGALADAVLRSLSRVKVTLVDVDPEMLAEARVRLAGYGDRVALRRASFLDPLPRADAVAASLALHHVHELEAKTRLYGSIHEALSSGGAFVNLDAVVSEDVRLTAVTFDRWAAHMAEQGIPAEEARDHFAAWAKEDRYFPLHAELAALRRAGFEEPECFCRRGPLAVYGGLKS